MSNNNGGGPGMSLGKIILGVGCGVVLAFVLIMGACPLLVGKAPVDASMTMEDQKAKRAAALAAIKLKDVDSTTSTGYVTVTGRACNEGTELAQFVKIGADFLNEQGQVVEVDFTYAASSEGIQPGACKEFSMMQRNSNGWHSYHVYVTQDKRNSENAQRPGPDKLINNGAKNHKEAAEWEKPYEVHRIRETPATEFEQDGIESAAAALLTAKLTLTSLGPVRLRMGRPELEAAVGELVVEPSPGVGCGYYYIRKDLGVSLMMIQGGVARIDLTDSHHSTTSGIHVGSTEVELERAYAGHYEVSPHRYNAAVGHYFTIRSPDKRFAMVFETDGEHVTYIRAGQLPFAEFVNKCH